MKRIFVFLIVVVVLFSLTGCSAAKSFAEGLAEGISDVSSETIAVQESKPVQEESFSTESGDEESEVVEEEAKKNEAALNVEESVLLEEQGVKITVKEFIEDGMFGPSLKLLIENNSGENLTFQTRNESVNGYMVDTLFSADVVNEKKANEELTFMESELEACGIETIADMEFCFNIFRTDDWETFIETAPIQIKTSAAENYVYSYDDSGEVVYDEEGIKIVIKGYSTDSSIFGPGIVVFIDNDSDKNITVQTRDVSVNGFMVDAIYSCDVVKGKCAVDAITFFDSDFEENGIESIEDVELYFHIFDMDEWDEIADTDVIQLGNFS